MALLEKDDDILTFFPIEAAAPPNGKDEHPPEPPKVRLSTRLFAGLLAAVAVFGFAIGAASLGALHERAQDDLKAAVGGFHWYVLVKGSQLEIDEVGRFLNQLDGVTRAQYVSPDESLERLAQQAALRDDIALLGANPLPGLWQVDWTPEYLPRSRFDDAFQDIKSLPAVVDVAFDPRAEEGLHIRRQRFLETATLLSALALIGVIAASLLVGRVLFFVRSGRWRPGRLAFLVAADGAIWALGAWTASAVFGPIPAAWYAGGLVLGLTRYLLSVADLA